MAKNSVLLWKGNGQAFLTEVLRQFCRRKRDKNTIKPELGRVLLKKKST
jgi:hypothetical protein